jgi:hypothetical protein
MIGRATSNQWMAKELKPAGCRFTCRLQGTVAERFSVSHAPEERSYLVQNSDIDRSECQCMSR